MLTPWQQQARRSITRSMLVRHQIGLMTVVPVSPGLILTQTCFACTDASAVWMRTASWRGR